jgi:acyl-CoA thioester hydrolase
VKEIKMIEAESIIEVPFHDVDCMRVVWHGHYVKYMEIARCTLLDKIDYNYPQMEQTGYVWPVIEVTIRYIKPLRFQQKIRVNAKLVEWENRLKINYLFEDFETGKRLTKGHTIQVAYDVENEEMMFASPDVLFEKLGIEL